MLDKNIPFTKDDQEKITLRTLEIISEIASKGMNPIHGYFTPSGMFPNRRARRMSGSEQKRFKPSRPIRGFQLVRRVKSNYKPEVGTNPFKLIIHYKDPVVG
jgi:hypothetical protein